MSTKLILTLGLVALLAYLGVSYGLRQRFPRVEVSTDTALEGRVGSAIHVINSHFFFLKGRPNTRYDFGAFVPAPGQDSLQQHRSSGLNRYLHLGDSLSKRAHSAELTVWRGKHLSRWVCPPVAAGQ